MLCGSPDMIRDTRDCSPAPTTSRATTARPATTSSRRPSSRSSGVIRGMRRENRPLRILLINPNTTASVTEQAAAHCPAADPRRDRAGDRPFRRPLHREPRRRRHRRPRRPDALAANVAGCDAVYLACFGDPGLLALKEGLPSRSSAWRRGRCTSPAPAGRRIGIVTGGVLWKPMLTEFVAMLGLSERLAGIRTVAPTGGEIARDPDAALDRLAGACRDCAGDRRGPTWWCSARGAGGPRRAGAGAGLRTGDLLGRGGRAGGDRRGRARRGRWSCPRPRAWVCRTSSRGCCGPGAEFRNHARTVARIPSPRGRREGKPTPRPWRRAVPAHAGGRGITPAPSPRQPDRVVGDIPRPGDPDSSRCAAICASARRSGRSRCGWPTR